MTLFRPAATVPARPFNPLALSTPPAPQIGCPGGDADVMTAEDEQPLSRLDGDAEAKVVPWLPGIARGRLGLASVPFAGGCFRDSASVHDGQMVHIGR
jgi:hypothetical protein